MNDVATPEQWLEIGKMMDGVTVGNVLDLGSGRQWIEHPDFTHLDRVPGDHIELVCILGEEPIPAADRAYDSARAHHILEHIPGDKVIIAIDEIWRVLKPKGYLAVECPDAHDPMAAWSDPSHCSPWTVKTPGYFTAEARAAFPYTKYLWDVKAVATDGSVVRVIMQKAGIAER